MSTKSLLVTCRIDIAGRAHDCQANSRHRINKGDVRLKVRNGLGWDHYCSECAKKIFAKDLAKIAQLEKLEPEVTE
ncbi:hypothetical protein [Massilia sp. YIM B04103]|uniref:hypothetical protein n=1 Tax=Massilia sp. YIM B04103 TaxID=2963106 RepID=UPI00210E83AC|nr:hypothetical protein [Massilia sp. YIM B04103]